MSRGARLAQHLGGDEPDAGRRYALVAAWTDLTDPVTANQGEEGILGVCELLVARGAGIEAGLLSVDDAGAFVAAGILPRCVRAMVEPLDPYPPMRCPTPMPSSAWSLGVVFRSSRSITGTAAPPPGRPRHPHRPPGTRPSCPTVVSLEGRTCGGGPTRVPRLSGRRSAGCTLLPPLYLLLCGVNGRLRRRASRPAPLRWIPRSGHLLPPPRRDAPPPPLPPPGAVPP